MKGFRAELGVLVALCVTPCPAQVTLVNDTANAGLIAEHDPNPDMFPSGTRMTGGMAVGDFNNDGFADLYWVKGGTGPNKLFINNGDGTFADEAAAWGVDAVHAGNSVSCGDYNDDGWMDIYVTSFGDVLGGATGDHRLYRNNGDGTFTNVASDAGVNATSKTIAGAYGSVFGDYDLDGDLDLFVAQWDIAAFGNSLFRNNGDGTFDNVTDDALGDAVFGVNGFTPTFVDTNGDLYPEILLTGDFFSSRYLINNGDGTFTDFTVEGGLGLDSNGMGQTVGDFNNDGLFDWYVTSIFSEDPKQDPSGNMLYLNQGGHFYDEVSARAGTIDGGFGWGAIAVDLDHDGWLDIVEVNGWTDNEFDDFGNEQAYLWRNNGDMTFTEMAIAAGLTHTQRGRSIISMDADHDGDLDIAIASNGQLDKNSGFLEFYRNDTDPSGNWLRIELETDDNELLPPNGFGAHVIATVDAQSYHRFQNSSPSYLGTSEAVIHFGLGEAAVIDELRIIWSRGYETVLLDVAVNQHLLVAGPALADLDANGIIGTPDLLIMLGAWGPVDQTAAIKADLDNDGTVGTTDLLRLLGDWG